MISCKEATMLIEQNHTQKLSFKQRLNLRIHRFLCKACDQYGIQSAWIDNVLKGLSAQQTLTSEEKDSLKEKLK